MSDSLKLKKVTITEGANVKIIEKSSDLDNFASKHMKISCTVTSQPQEGTYRVCIQRNMFSI